MKFDQSFQTQLLNDAIGQLFDDVDDLVSYVQNRVGKPDSSIVTSYWLGQEHLLKDKTTVANYIKYECER